MPWRSRTLLLALACLVVATATAQPAAAQPGATPVPSLDPQGTQALWVRLTSRREIKPLAADVGCRPLRGVFYAQTD